MDPQENTKKTGPDQEQQTGQPATERKSEPARKCQFCKGPDHHGCGCEARAAKEKSRIDLNALPKIHYAEDEQPEDEYPDEASMGEIMEKILSADVVKEARELSLQQSKDIHTMAESCEDFKTLICDMAATLKVIAGDLITIRKHLSKEEVKNAVENQN